MFLSHTCRPRPESSGVLLLDKFAAALEKVEEWTALEEVYTLQYIIILSCF
jgi:hypothetical protein